MFEQSDFRAELDSYMNDYDSYTKEELYNAYLKMTERFLDELINMRLFESILVQQLGEEEGNALIEKIYENNDSITELDMANAKETDPKKKILNLLAFIENGHGLYNEQPDGDEQGSKLIE